MGLTALARWGRLAQSSITDMNIEITYEGGSQSIQINNANAIVLQEIEVSEGLR